MDDLETVFQVHADPDRDATLVALGELDATTAPTLRAALAQAAAASDGELRLDLAGVTFIDSSGLQAIAATLRELRAVERELRIEGASRAVRRIFEVTGLRALLVVDPPEPAAG